MATIREQIVDFLRGRGTVAATNQTIASTIQRPEPSVRRMTLQLENRGVIRNVSQRYNQLEWVLN